jgi:23S rRNA (adenine2030-N6)-methyltransferase
MLSYQHGYHAGNHADVLKHVIVLAIVRHLQDKDAPITYIDTHAGAGAYALHQAQALKTAEATTGIQRLYEQIAAQQAPWASDPLIADYLQHIAAFNPSGQLNQYPGSPLLLLANLRNARFIADTLRVFERHPAERQLLEAHLMRNTAPAPLPSAAPAGLRVSRVRPVLIQGDEGFAGLPTLLPPANRRALVLIDPSYEIKTDYRSVLESLRAAMGKFPTGTYAVWYPMLKRIEAQQLIPRLKTLCGQHKGCGYLNATLAVSAPQPDGFGGLWGSGMFIINPPWTLAAQLKTTLPALKTALGISKDARWTVETA